MDKLYDNRTKRAPAPSKKYLAWLGNLGDEALSKRMNPRPPSPNMKPAVNPSMIYCPLTLHFKKATGLDCLVTGSCSDPMAGGSTITSYMIPDMTKKYEKKRAAKTIMG